MIFLYKEFLCFLYGHTIEAYGMCGRCSRCQRYFDSYHINEFDYTSEEESLIKCLEGLGYIHKGDNKHFIFFDDRGLPATERTFSIPRKRK